MTGKKKGSPVSSSNDGGIGTFGVGQGEHALRLVDGALRGPRREEVGREGGVVRVTHALHPDVVAELALKRRGHVGAGAETLQITKEVSALSGSRGRLCLGSKTFRGRVKALDRVAQDIPCCQPRPKPWQRSR